jgi:ribosome-associated heat shock protein Hsp15
MTPEATERVRVDIWLWCVRLHKTRQLAKKACLSGHVTIDGRRAKPASVVHPGDTVTVTTPRGKKIVEVLALPATRVSAATVGAFALDHTPPPPPATSSSGPVSPVWRERGLGRPTKKDRRAIEKWRSEGR